MPVPPIEERWLKENFGDLTVGLVHYGSTAFGQTRSGSTRDYWVVVRDLREFHTRFQGCLRARLRQSAARRVQLNRVWPCFFAVEEGGLRLKMAVISEDAFCRLCRAKSYYVKGRMQKPVRVLAATPRMGNAIRDARLDGVEKALDLLPDEFGLEQFLRALLRLSYLTEIRPELTGRKVDSILQSGRGELESIYRPLLEQHPMVERRDGRFRDRRSPSQKKRARSNTLRELRAMKWSGEALRNIHRNYLTHPHPLRYVLGKVAGEFEKLFTAKNG